MEERETQNPMQPSQNQHCMDYSFTGDCWRKKISQTDQSRNQRNVKPQPNLS